jgi:hypothetical protein
VVIIVYEVEGRDELVVVFLFIILVPEENHPSMMQDSRIPEQDSRQMPDEEAYNLALDFSIAV